MSPACYLGQTCSASAIVQRGIILVISQLGYITTAAWFPPLSCTALSTALRLLASLGIMFNTTVTIDNPNPLITYLPSGAWVFRTPSNPADAALDGAYARYSMGGTFSLTSTYSASASFTFNGTSVTLYGANRYNHGFYNITLDGTFQGSFNCSTDDPNGVWGPLYWSGELEEGSHTVVFINAPVPPNNIWLDLDYVGVSSTFSRGFITFTTSVSTQTTLVQDTDPSFDWRGSGWSTNVTNENQYNGTSGQLGGVHISRDSVQIYGVLGPSQGSYSIALDDQPISQIPNGYQDYFYADTLLYAASELPVGLHNVTLTNLASSYTCLGIDYAIAGLARVVPSTSTSAISPTAAGTHSSNLPNSTNPKTSIGAIVGGVVGGVAVLSLVLAGLWFFRCRRRGMPRTAPLIEHPPNTPMRESVISSTRETGLGNYSYPLPSGQPLDPFDTQYVYQGSSDPPTYGEVLRSY
ncbi:hypothetical protein NEOLEDRAFT_1152426 [Neolentinus lepideus HHB14362 ss-1]|uniref:Uncharacterized protein n=1 Tax=Neolentinus lepideus HHB14362 ss-1 TaxID=1314782 RepID=A0A165MTB2_9AGAM|nr:hypothetical protein NEOLEDRAFT_1152426 [Neolentinus lepideus HHB14362 ss-1]